MLRRLKIGRHLIFILPRLTQNRLPTSRIYIHRRKDFQISYEGEEVRTRNTRVGEKKNNGLRREEPWTRCDLSWARGVCRYIDYYRTDGKSRRTLTF